MKYIFTFTTILMLFLGCRSNPQWEYKTLKVYPTSTYERTGADALRYNTISPSESELTKLGFEGWELVTSYLEMETAFPNFGNDSYVTGIRENVRPQMLFLIFKRPWSGEFENLVENK